MNSVLRVLIERGGGLVTRDAALRMVPRWAVQDACRSGRLVRLLPEVYVDADLVNDTEGGPPLARVEPGLARRAVLAYAGWRGALSHLTALDVWGLRRQPAAEPLHVEVPAESGIRTRTHIVAHHRRGFAAEPPRVVVRGGTAVTRLERSLVDAWPLPPLVDRSVPLIQAVNDRLTTPQRVDAALGQAPRLGDRAGLRRLLDRLVAGCRSPLEIWGHDHVFTGPGMPAFRRQARVRVGAQTVYLDLFAEAERVDIELDGATTHGDPREREIDLRRDALLATRGILVVASPTADSPTPPTRSAARPSPSSLPAAPTDDRLSRAAVAAILLDRLMASRAGEAVLTCSPSDDQGLEPPWAARARSIRGLYNDVALGHDQRRNTVDSRGAWLATAGRDVPTLGVPPGPKSAPQPRAERQRQHPPDRSRPPRKMCGGRGAPTS
ncbi:hypothetical protein ACVCAH_29350 [Micromonospora sp. LZ34]